MPRKLAILEAPRKISVRLIQTIRFELTLNKFHFFAELQGRKTGLKPRRATRSGAAASGGTLNTAQLNSCGDNRKNIRQPWQNWKNALNIDRRRIIFAPILLHCHSEVDDFLLQICSTRSGKM